MPHERTTVLIVGGGPVGLSTALFLARQGIQPILVERRPTISQIPRATGVHSRTIELWRMAGLEPAFREVGLKFANASGLDVEEYNAGRETPLAMYGTPSIAALNENSPLLEDHDVPYYDFTPCWPLWCGQDHYEPILLADAVSNGADIRFNAELVGLDQDANGVTAVIRDRVTDVDTTIRADYLVGADGVNSRVRGLVDIGTLSHGIADHFVSIIFRADIDRTGKPPFTFLSLFNREVPGLLLAIEPGRWMIGAIYYPERGQSPADYTEQRAIEVARIVAGDPDLAVRIESINPWEAKHQVADEYQNGRVFLAGDAAHCHPPAGGFGVNTGVQDAHNLAWKLAAVLQSWAEPSLLATYAQERRPIGVATSEYAWLLFSTRQKGVAEDDLLAAERDLLHSHVVVVTGYRYDSDAIIGAPEGVPALPTALEFDGSPGSRAPHAWLTRATGEQVSTLDLFGFEFVLLTGRDGSAWATEAIRAAKQLGIPLRTHVLGADGDLIDQDDALATATGIGTTGALLVRPDGFVGWQATGAQAGTELADAFTAIAGKGQA